MKADSQPNSVEYKTSDAVKEQLAEADALDEGQIIMTYQVNASDLSNYKRVQNYKPGKANPFAPYADNGASNVTQGNSNNANGGTTTNTNNNTNNTDNTNNNTNNQNTTEERFFQNTGTK